MFGIKNKKEKVNTEEIKQDDFQDYFSDSEEELKEEFKVFKIKKALSKLGILATAKTMTKEEIKNYAINATEYGLKGVLVMPINVGVLKNTEESVGDLKNVALISYPFGEATVKTKTCEAKECVKAGADEICFTPSCSKISSGDYKYVKHELKKVKKKIKNSAVFVLLADVSVLGKDGIIRLGKISEAERVLEIRLFGFNDKDSLKETITALTEVSSALNISLIADISSAEEFAGVIKLGINSVFTPHAIEIAKEFTQKYNINL